MGWGSAGGLFNDIVHAMIDAGVEGDKLTDICEKIIRQFQEGDWDTEDESLEAFQELPAVVEAFRRCDVHPSGHRELTDLFMCEFGISRERAENLAEGFLPVMREAAKAAVPVRVTLVAEMST